MLRPYIEFTMFGCWGVSDTNGEFLWYYSEEDAFSHYETQCHIYDDWERKENFKKQRPSFKSLAPDEI